MEALMGGLLKVGFLSSSTNVRIVSTNEQTMKKATSEHPYYYRNVVKAKSYKGVEQDVLIMGFTTAVFTLASDADFIYKFLKNLFDHRREYYSIYTSAKN